MSEAEQADDVFDLERLHHLIDIMKEHGLSEVDLQQGDQKIRLARAGTGAVVQPLAAPQAAPAPAPAAEVAAVEDENIAIIKSPMVGTFYARPNPNSEPYIRVGSNVDPETTVCIIEAMKVFNEIPAEVRGQIVAVLAEDEEPVDTNKPLFKVDTSK